MNPFNPLAGTPEDDTDDLALVRRIEGGDRDALEALVVRHQPWIYNIVVRMVYHPHDAEDVTQEVLIKVLTKLSTFEGRSRFRTCSSAASSCSTAALASTPIAWPSSGSGRASWCTRTIARGPISVT